MTETDKVRKELESHVKDCNSCNSRNICEEARILTEKLLLIGVFE